MKHIDAGDDLSHLSDAQLIATIRQCSERDGLERWSNMKSPHGA